MKKLLVLLLALIMCLTALTSCDVNDILGYIIKPVEEYDTDSALAYLKNMYKGENSVTATDYEVIGQIYISGVKYTVTWTSSNDKVKVEALENGNWLINVDEKSKTEETYTLTATITAENGDTRTHSYERSVPKYNVLSWDQYMQAAENDVVLVEGIVVGMNSVSKGNKRNHLFLADASGKGGYYCYILTSDPVTDGIEIGMTVSVSGTVSPYSGMQEIKNCTATIVDKTIKEVTPVDMTSVFSQATPDYSEYVGRLVTIKGVKIGSQDLATETSQYLYFTIGGVKGYVRTYITDMCHEVANADAKKTIDEAHAAHFGWTADATGILILYSGNPYLIPVSTTPFEYKELVQATAAEKIADSADSISIASKVASDTTIELPLEGANYDDVTIAWTSNNECATVGADGKLTIKLQDEAQTVTLTATFTCGETTETKTFTIEVAAKPLGNEISISDTALGLGTYADGQVTIGGADIAFIELGAYGNGIQMRNKLADGGKKSQIWNANAFAKPIAKIELVYSSTKSTYNNADVFVVSFGNDINVSSYTTKLSTVAGTKTYTVTPDAATYTYFKFEVADSYTYTSYWDSIRIVFADGSVVTDGEYTIAAGDTFIGALASDKTFGYLPKVDTATTFTVKNVAGGVTIQDSYGRYLYSQSDYNSISVSTDVQTNGSHIWKVTKNGDGTYTFVNAVTEKTIAYSTSYSSAGAYATVEDGNVANLTLTAKGGSEEHTHNITDDNFTPEQPATCTSVGKKGHFYCEVCQKAFDRDGNEIEDLTIAINPDAHKWADATCTTAKTCEFCSKVEGEALGHEFENGKCTHTGCTLAVPTEEGKVTLYFTLREDSVEIPKYLVPYITGGAWSWGDWCKNGSEMLTNLEGTDVWYVISNKTFTAGEGEYKILIHLAGYENHNWEYESVVHSEIGGNAKYTYVEGQNVVDLGKHGFSSLPAYPTEDTKWVVVGSFNGWSHDADKAIPLTETATKGVYETIYLDVPAGTEYKITNGNWKDKGGIEVFAPDSYGSNFKIETAGKYKLVFNVNTWTVTVVAESHTCTFDESNWTAEVPATCINEGTKGHYTCSCGKYYDKDHNELTDLTIAKAEHTWSDWTTTATCTEAGTKSRHCTVEGCVGEESEADAALGHVDENGDFLCDYNCGTVIIEDGDYSIKAGDVAMGTLAASKNYGYIPSSESGVITIKNVEGGYTLQDVFGRYLYMSGTYDSFNLTTEPTSGHIFTIASNGDGKFTIVNVAMNKTLCYTSYKTFAAYTSVGTNVADLTIAASTHKHSYDSVTVTTEPKDCATSGKGLTTCACGHTKDEVAVAPLAHKCDNGAYCSVCGRWVLEAKDLEAVSQFKVDTTEYGYFTSIWKNGSSKIDANEKVWADGYASGMRFNHQGKLTIRDGKVTAGAIKFTTTEATTVRLWWVNNGENRQMVIYQETTEGLVQVAATEGTMTNKTAQYSEFALESAGTFYLGAADGGTNWIYKVEVDHAHTYGEDDKCACGAEKPAATTTTTVTHKMSDVFGSSSLTNKTGDYTKDGITYHLVEGSVTYNGGNKDYRVYASATSIISSTKGISSITAKMRASKASNTSTLTFEVSNDGENWTKITTTTWSVKGTSLAEQTVDFGAAYKYVKFVNGSAQSQFTQFTFTLEG